MQLSYSEEQQMFADSAQRFVQDNYEFTQREKILKQERGYSQQHWQYFAQLGWAALPISESNEGLGGSLKDVCALQRVLGSAMVQEPYLSSIILSGKLIDRLGTQAQVENYLTPVMAGQKCISLAYQEPQSRYDAANVTATATTTEQGFSLNGVKSFVIDGTHADAFIISARNAGEANDTQGVSLFIIDAKQSGVVLNNYISADDRHSCELILTDVKIGADCILGQLGEGLESLQAVIDFATGVNCADMVGAMQVLLDDTVSYAKERKQFGQPIGKFQVLQHRMADMYIALERAESMLTMLEVMYQQSDDSRQLAQAVSAAKVQINKSARYIAQQAVQIHGGIGITEELNIGHFFKRLIVTQSLFGDTQYHLQRYINAG